MAETHKTLTLRHLQDHGSITSWDAIQKYGNTRLSDTIHRLRREGYEISTKMIPFKKYGITSQFAEYSITQ